MKRLSSYMISFTLCGAILLTACGQSASAANESKSGQTDAAAAAEQLFTERELEQGYDESAAVTITLKGDTAESTGSAVTISGSTVTITDEGVYLLTGTLDNGSIIVDAKKTDKVELVLSDASITSADYAALYVKQADKVFVTLDEGTENTLSSSGSFAQKDDNNVDGTVFSKDDLVLKGEGGLTIVSESGNGVVSKDELTISGGSYTITAAGHGLESKESVLIGEAVLSIVSGKDGIQAKDSDDETVGEVILDGAALTIDAGSDGISAGSSVTVLGGTLDITASDSAESAKGIKAGESVSISGGEISIDSANDSIHSNGDVTVSSGSISITSQDDGIHADQTVAISGGSIDILDSYEGIEGLVIDISGGEISLNASDDGLNAAGGNDGSGYMGPWGRDQFASVDGCEIRISGGKIEICARGDGVDSNGNLTVSGGEVYVSGAANGGNGALDYNGSGTITGGFFVAAGPAQMAMNFGNASTQCSMLVSTGNQQKGTEIRLKDSSGKTLLSYTPSLDYGCILISSPDLAVGETYTVEAGSNSSTVQMDSTLYGTAGGFGGMMGGFGGHGGGMMPQDGMSGEQLPEGMTGERPQGGFNGAQPADGAFPEGGFGGYGGRGMRPGEFQNQ